MEEKQDLLRYSRLSSVEMSRLSAFFWTQALKLFPCKGMNCAVMPVWEIQTAVKSSFECWTRTSQIRTRLTMSGSLRRWAKVGCQTDRLPERKRRKYQQGRQGLRHTGVPPRCCCVCRDALAVPVAPTVTTNPRSWTSP